VEPEGIYFPGLGSFDLTGDGVEDIKLILVSESIPAEKEVNSLGKPLIYYRAGTIGEDAGVYLTEGASGTVQTTRDMGTFIEPKYYYRPIPQNDVKINPKLNQIFGWE
jgi:starch-binding outer membrane protein, SusD/RagB family